MPPAFFVCLFSLLASNLVQNPKEKISHVKKQRCTEAFLLLEYLKMPFFSRFGTVKSVRCLPEKYCAFVNFSTKEAAGKAMQSLQVCEPRREKSRLRDFRTGPTQTSLYSHRRRLEAENFGFGK